MDPVTGMIAVAGLGMQLFGGAMGLNAGMNAAAISAQEALVSQSITSMEGQENSLRQQAMNLSANRQKIQDFRQMQLQKSQALAAGVNQGGQFGSGVQGGVAQATTSGQFNVLGVNQQQQIGNQLFGIQYGITGKQIQMSQLESQQANYQGQQAMWGGIASIGGSLANSAGPMGNILGQWFGSGDLTQPLPGSSPLGQGGIGHA